jgi:hypothetical protein
MWIDLLDILDPILKLYVFYTFFMYTISLKMGKMVLGLARAMEKTTNLNIIFLIICWYLNLVKNQRKIL